MPSYNINHNNNIYQKKTYDIKAILEPNLLKIPNLGAKEEVKATSLDGIGEKDTEELRRKMMLLDMHKKSSMKHEPYL